MLTACRSRSSLSNSRVRRLDRRGAGRIGWEWSYLASPYLAINDLALASNHLEDWANPLDTDKVRPKFEELGILEYETMSYDGDIDWMKLERLLGTGEAQSHEQSMLAPFHDAHRSHQVAAT